MTDIKLKKCIRAFTIIELLVVLTILSILVMLLLPKVNHFLKDELSLNNAEKICQELRMAQELAIYRDEAMYVVLKNNNLYIMNDQKIIKEVFLDKRFHYRLKSSKSFSHQDDLLKINQSGDWHRYGRIEIYTQDEKLHEILVSSEGRIRVIKRST